VGNSAKYHSISSEAVTITLNCVCREQDGLLRAAQQLTIDNVGFYVNIELITATNDQ